MLESATINEESEYAMEFGVNNTFIKDDPHSSQLSIVLWEEKKQREKHAGETQQKTERK